MRKNSHLDLIDVYLHTPLTTTNLQPNHAPAEGEVVSVGCYIISVHHTEDLLCMHSTNPIWWSCSITSH